jgi:hypothetical protein
MALSDGNIGASGDNEGSRSKSVDQDSMAAFASQRGKPANGLVQGLIYEPAVCDLDVDPVCGRNNH